MSSFSARAVEIWRSSQAEEISPICGAFSIEVLPTLMVPQTLQFLAECAANPPDGVGGISSAFLQGMRYLNPREPRLLFWRGFSNSDELFSFDPGELFAAVRQLEVHADINLTFGRASYLADVGRGPELPLWMLSRLPFSRAVAFEIEERDAARASLGGGDLQMTDKVRVAQQHYSTGTSLLACEDSVSGLVDAAFMQFYLAMESVLECHERAEALKAGAQMFGGAFDRDIQKIVSHVYLARHRFFGHAHPKYLGGMVHTKTAFDIAKQTLVARWCARRLIELELKRPLVKRELRLYAGPQKSVAFFGDASSLLSEFNLP